MVLPPQRPGSSRDDLLGVGPRDREKSNELFEELLWRYVHSEGLAVHGDVMRFVLLLLPMLALAAAYQYVSRQIASGQTSVPFVGTPVTLKPIDPNSFMGSFSVDSREMERLNGENIANQTRLFNQRM
jgi:hypothetical protein